MRTTNPTGSNLVLHTFLSENREKILDRARAQVASRPAPRATEAELESGLPLFLTQLAGMLRPEFAPTVEKMAESATKHGDDLLRLGFTVGQVVHDYGGICQSITELAVEGDISISSAEFKILNGCLDDAIASAVSEFVRQRERAISAEGAEHLGFLAHELRNALNAATLAFEVLKTGTVGTGGSTADLLARSLGRMRELIDRSLLEVRLQAGIQKRTRLVVARLIEEVAISGAVEARRRGLDLSVGPVADDVTVDADPHILVSALENLLQNAFKFTRPRGHVTVQTVVTADRVRIEIEDECGGLPDGKVEELFRVFQQRAADRSGLGLGLAISQQGVEASGGRVLVVDLPGKGCIFAVDLPRQK
jgi:signal transduction histidine kinase